MPKPFLNKLIVHGAIGFFCVLFGCIYGFITDDQIFLLMSLCIGVGTAIRIVSLLHTIKMHDYTELTGTCTMVLCQEKVQIKYNQFSLFM